MAEQEIDERALIARAKSDREAFGALYELYVQRIYNYIYYRTGNHHDAEDLTARVFFRALQHIGRYQDHGAPFSAWLYRIARNLLANWYRDESRRQMIALDHVAHHFATEDLELTSELGEDRDTLLAAIRRLPAERQELLILKHLERLPNVEIGQIMGRSEGAIKSLYYRTLVALQQELANQDGTARGPATRSERHSEE
jgi:RNA polymerase sigma-70 factor (ECF subfamily)